MERKVMRSKHETWVRFSARLKVGGKAVRVRADVPLSCADEVPRRWRLNRRQMVSLLRALGHEAWLVKSGPWWDPHYEREIPGDKDFKPMTEGFLEWLVKELEMFKAYINYKVSEGTFDIHFSHGLGGVELKPLVPVELK